MTREAEHLIGTVLAGRYEVTGVLGAGGMGVVLEARQVAMDRKVAVKLLHPAFGTNRHAVARFVREMQVTSRLEHASTVRVYDFGETTDADGARLFLVMELVQGRTLGKILAEGSLTHARVVAIAAQIARALEAAHSEGIVHRDLKPDNVMLVDRYGATDQVKVLDFGIARFFDGAEGDGVGKLTAEGAVVGTPSYMSPEQATGSPIGPASDLYSLGVMLFEMATGVVPFSAPTTVSLMVKHVQESPPRPSEIAPMLARLEELILACLAKVPDARPASAKALAEALEAIGRELGALPAAAEAGPAHVARAAKVELQKSKALAADTARNGSGSLASEAETGKRVEDDVAVPPRKSSRPWWIAGAVAAVAVLVAVIVLGSGDKPATVAPARPLEVVADATVIDADVSSPEVGKVPTDARAEPSAPAGCAVTVVAEARAAVKARAQGMVALAMAGVQACPQWAVSHLTLGQAAQAAKAWDAARASFARARDLAPGWGLPRFDLALSELSAGAPDTARATLVELLALAPDWEDARLLKAQVELARKDFEGAKSDAEAATIASPERAEAWFLLGESVRAMGASGSADAAKDAYCKAKALGMDAARARCEAAP